MGFCNDITPTCDTCYEITYGNCNDTLTFNLGLGATTNYYLNLIDKYDIVNEEDVVTDGSGDFTIVQTWTEFFGAVEVEIYDDAPRTNRVSFTISGTTYDCIILKP